MILFLRSIHHEFNNATEFVKMNRQPNHDPTFYNFFSLDFLSQTTRPALYKGDTSSRYREVFQSTKGHQAKCGREFKLCDLQIWRYHFLNQINALLMLQQTPPF